MSDAEDVYELLVDLGNGLEALGVDIKQRISKKMKTSRISEEPFLALKWEKREGSRLREYEVSTKVLDSGSENFQRCLNILKQNNATIGNRLKDVGWLHSYWLYGESIYRQPLKV